MTARFHADSAERRFDGGTTPGTNGTKLRAAILREWARQRRTEAAG